MILFVAGIFVGSAVGVIAMCILQEKVTMLKFICGVLVGGIIGVVLMCLLQINKIR